MTSLLRIAIGLLMACATIADAQEKRRVFVLHSGMHMILAPKDKDHAARTMHDILRKRGIPERDLIALPSPFPTATAKEMLPKEGLDIYLKSTDPKSQVSHDAYVRLHKALQSHGVSAKDDIVWIGHSAGGQMGMTMAHLAHNLDKFPELAKKTQPFHFDAVITLGTPVGSNPTPPNVKLRHYCSPGDTMVYFLANHSELVPDAKKAKIRFRLCCDLGPNALLRVFPNIEHPNWYDVPILERILNEFDPRYCPAWRRTQADVGRGVGLSQLLATSIEAGLQISIEE